MAENTKIEWAHHTFNPWIGCTKVSPACDHCYAEASFDKHRKVVKWGAGQPRKHTAPSTWKHPERWNAEAQRLGVRYRVFCASLADVFDNEVPQAWRQELMSLIARTPNLDWLLLTKRIGNARRMLNDACMHDGLLLTANDEYRPPANLWIGATIANQEEADRDIPKLLAVPAAKRFLSMEPLLGAVDLTRIPMRDTCASECCGNWRLDVLKGASYCGEVERDPCHESDEAESIVDWVIVGGESGPQARPMHPDWARSLRDQCEAAGVPFLFKQWGEWTEIDTGLPQPLLAHFGDPEFYDAAVEHDGFLSLDGHFVDNPDLMNDDVPYRGLVRVGKKAAGRLLDGRTWDGVPS